MILSTRQDASVVISSGPSESPHANYSFMVVPFESSSSALPEFFAMIQQLVFSAFLSSCLEFVSESNMPPSAGIDVCPPRHPRYIIFSFLGIMPRVSTELHLHVVHINDITRYSNLQ